MLPSTLCELSLKHRMRPDSWLWSAGIDIPSHKISDWAGWNKVWTCWKEQPFSSIQRKTFSSLLGMIKCPWQHLPFLIKHICFFSVSWHLDLSVQNIRYSLNQLEHDICDRTLLFFWRRQGFFFFSSPSKKCYVFSFSDFYWCCIILPHPHPPKQQQTLRTTIKDPW